VVRVALQHRDRLVAGDKAALDLDADLLEAQPLRVGPAPHRDQDLVGWIVGLFPVELDGRTFRPNERSRWKTNEEGMDALKRARRLQATERGLYYVRYFDDFSATGFSDVWDDTVIAGFVSSKGYVVETSTKVVQRCLLMTTDPGDLVLDPTCGSGTTLPPRRL